MRKLASTIIIALILCLPLLSISPALAWSEVGTIRIEPHGSYYPQPIMLSSPATFNITVKRVADPTKDPHILLVMSNASYHGLTTDGVIVNWTGGSITFHKNDFISVSSSYIPPSGTTKAVRYQVSSLRDHLSVPDTEPVWYALGPFLSGPITVHVQMFTVTLNSTSTRVLVYAIGKTGCSDKFNNRVPPTRAGFVVPDPGTMPAAAASFSALGAFVLYGIKRRKK